jgi:hypothetical protein
MRLPFPVPFLANEIAAMSVGRPLVRTGRLSRTRVPASVWSRKGMLAEVRVWRQSDIRFYLFLTVFALLPLLPRYTNVRQHWNEWIQKSPSPARPLNPPRAK